jgi:hypothetical protein
MIRSSVALLIACLLTATIGASARAADIEPLQGSLPVVAAAAPILTIKAGGRSIPLTLAAIERLPLKQSTLNTGFGLSGTFQGVLLTDLMAAYGLTGAERLGIRAGDDYAISVKAAEIAASPGFLATRFDGKPITDPNKGPLLLLWPAQDEDLLAGRVAGTEWVWSVNEIDRMPR